MLSGHDVERVCDVIASAFTQDELDRLLYGRLDLDRRLLVADGPFLTVVHDVVRVAQRLGKEAALIVEVAEARPSRPDAQELYELYVGSLLDEGRQKALDEARLSAIERFGLGPRVSLQKAGVQQLIHPATVGNPGLQRRVRQDLPSVNMALWAEQILRLGAQVCRVEIQGSGVGTGFLVGPNTLLTNHHVLADVIESPSMARDVLLRFDCRLLRTGLPAAGTTVRLAENEWLLDSSPPSAGERQDDPDAMLPTVDELDYALLRLARPIGLERLREQVAESSVRGWVYLRATEPAIAVGMPLAIVQHQRSLPLTLALDTSAVLSVNANRTRVRYSTNTDEGSSGSPCFDIQLGIIAIHHYGDPLHDRAGYNQGVPIETIRQRLARLNKLDLLAGEPPL